MLATGEKDGKDEEKILTGKGKIINESDFCRVFQLILCKNRVNGTDIW